jgi:hypothetical protein
MPIQKIKSGRIITVALDDFVGEKGLLFFDEDIGSLRLGDGSTPGGRLLNAENYTLPVASNSTLGGVKIGDNIFISSDGTISVSSSSSYVLPVATTSTLGGIKVGSNLTISPDGTLNAVSIGTSISDTFKTIVATSGSNLIASGEDVLKFVAGAGIQITSNPNDDPYQSITIESFGFGNLDGGFPDSNYGGDLVFDGGGI